MIVIADTTPLNHLILIDQVSVLEALYKRVVVPLLQTGFRASPEVVQLFLDRYARRRMLGSSP